MGASYLYRKMGSREVSLRDFGVATETAQDLELDLIHEAESLFRSGDVEGARHRLGLWAWPKWAFPGECEDRYSEHMAAQRAAQSGSRQ